MEDFKDKVAFITGGASGVGLGQAKVLAGLGVKVVLADIRQDHLDFAPAVLDSAHIGDITGARAQEMYLALWVRLFAKLKTPNVNIHVVF